MKREKWIAEKDASDNTIASLQNLLLQLKIKVMPNKISEVISTDADYPSIESLSRSLQTWNIDTMMVRLEEKDLINIPLPAIGHMNENSKTDKPSHYIVITEINSESITYIDTQLGFISESITLFIKKWSGILLLAQANEHSGDHNYEIEKKEIQLKKLRTFGIYTAITIVLISAVFYGMSKFSFGLWLPVLGLKIIGSILSIIVLNYTFGGSEKTLNLLCSIGTKKKKNSGCITGVLDSPAAKLWGWLSMSEIGLLYFMGGLSTLFLALFSSQSYSVLGILALLNVLALPYTFFSIYYQGVVVKKWCSVCLSIQVILWIEAIVLFSVWKQNLGSALLESIPSAILGFTITALIWMIIRPNYGLKQRFSKQQSTLRDYEEDPMFFERLLSYNSAIVQQPIEGDMILGNPYAKHTLTLVSSPFCSACKVIHAQLKELLIKNKEDLRVVLRIPSAVILPVEEAYQELKKEYDSLPSKKEKKEFVGTYGKEKTWKNFLNKEKNSSELKNEVIIHLMALSKKNTTIFSEAIEALYLLKNQSKKAIENWKHTYPIGAILESELKNTIEFEMDIISAWVHEEHIASIPSLFFNGIPVANRNNVLGGLNNYIAYQNKLEIDSIPLSSDNLSMKI